MSQEADYVLAVKENQGRLLEDVEDLFSCGQRTGFEDMKHDFCQTLDKGYGRIETRRCWTVDDPEQLSYVETGRYWPAVGRQPRGLRKHPISVTGRFVWFAWAKSSLPGRIIVP